MRDLEGIHDSHDLGILLKISKSLNINNLEDTLRLLTQETAKAVEAAKCTIFLLDRKKQQIYSRVMADDWETIRFPKGKGIAGYVIDSGTEVITDDPYIDPRFNPEIDKETGFKTTGIMCIPIRAEKDGVIGCIQVINKLHGNFSSKDREFVVSLGDAVANILQSTLVFDEKKELVEELEATKASLLDKVNQMNVILKLEKANNQATPIEQCLQFAIEEAVKATEANAGSILLFTESEEEQLTFSFVVGEKSNELKAKSLHIEEGLAGAVLKSGAPLIENELGKNKKHAKYIDQSLDFVTENIMACPLRYTDLDGERKTVNIGVVEVLNSNKGYFDKADLSFFQVICAQITSMIQRKRILDKKEASKRLEVIGKVSSSIIHDIKNPLNVIMNAAQFLGADEIPIDRRKKFAQMIHRQSHRMEAMAKEVLNFIKEDMKFEFEEIPASEFFQELFDLLDVECELKEIELVKNINYNGLIRIDKAKIERAIFNLTNNAFGVLEPGNKITISCNQNDEFVLIKVADDGPGLPEQVLNNIFQAFVTHNKAEGTGLGLNIVKSIVEAHGGQVSVNPNAKQGAEFHIELPLPLANSKVG